MSASAQVKYFDLQQELISLSTHLYRNMDFPVAMFESEPKSCSHSKFLFPCAEPNDLYFSSFYGDSWVSTINKSSKRWVISRKVRRKSPHAVSVEAVREGIAECIDSVKETDKEFATLKLIIGNVYFEGQREITVDEQDAFLEGTVRADQYYVHFPTSRMFFFHQTCEWTCPSKALKFLEKSGFSITSREPLNAEVSLALRRGFIRRKIGHNKFLYFDNNLKLNPTTLAVESWRVQNWFPMNYHIMHGFPSSNDVIVRTNVKRYAKFDYLFALHDRDTPGLMADDEQYGSFIQRTDVGFKLVNRYEDVKCITETGDGERIHLQHDSVSCFINLAPVRYFYFNSMSNEFTLSEDQNCEAVIEFPLSGNREELIEVIARLSLELFSNANDDDELPLETPPSFINQSDGTRISSLDIQAIIRLHHERGNMYHLLGLGDNSNRKECLRRAIALKKLLLNNCEQEWFRRINLDFDELMEKLTCACEAYDISV